jgi:hypothetical protein
VTVALTVISEAAAFTRVREALRFPAYDAANGVSLPLIGQALRRAAHILAPCPRHELERAVRQSFKGFALDAEELTNRTADALEALLAYGDILEMQPPADDPWTISPLIVRPAPPAFVQRKAGSMIILGVAGEEITPLSSEVNKRLAWHGVLRILAPEGAENLRPFLAELGLIELSERTWLRLPPIESAPHHRAAWTRRLADTAPISVIEGLEVLDIRKSPTFYSGRWVEPHSTLNGVHIGRRAQRYGASLWCLVDLAAGVPHRFLDLALRRERERPCDLAWRIQMAMDADAGAPQRVRLRQTDGQVVLDFFSPLPSWAERKLAVVGERTARHRSLLSYLLPQHEVDETIKFMNDYLWITLEA